MNISIIGLGWIGMPLYRMLRQSGHKVLGSVTSAEKAAKLRLDGVDAFEFRLTPEPEGPDQEALFDAEVLVINIPPGRRKHPPSFHPEQMRHLSRILEGTTIKYVVYVSSTSIYPDIGGEVYESDSINLNNTGNATLYMAEHIWREALGGKVTVIRFGGLLGDDRIPGKYFSGKENVVGYAPANYVYRSDAARAIQWIIEKMLWGETYNVVAPIHPTKREIFEANARDLGFVAPLSYAKADKLWKKVSSERIQQSGFRFDYPNPLDFPYKIVE